MSNGIKISVLLCLICALAGGCSSGKNANVSSGLPGGNKADSTYNNAALDAFLRGSMADLKNDHAAAILEYQDALRLEARPAVYYALAKDYLLLNKLSLALPNAKTAVKSDPENTEFIGLLAEIYAAAKLNDSAALCYENIIRLDSSNVNAYYNLGALYSNQKPLQAIKIYKKLITLVGAEWTVLVQLADIYERMGNQEEAIKTEEDLLSIDPSNFELKKLLIQTYIKSKNYDKALQAIDDSQLQYPDDVDLLDLKAQTYIQKSEYKEAAKVYEILFKNPRLPLEAKIRVGTLFLGQGQSDSTIVPVARRLFEILDKDTTDWQVKLLLGEIAIYQKDDSSVVKYLNEVIRLAGWNSDGYIKLGGLYFDRRNYTKAIELLLPAVEKFPEDFAINLIIGLSLSQTDKNEEALKFLIKASALNSKDVMALSALGYIYQQLKQPDNAIEFLNRAIAIDSANAGLYGTLGLVYNELKRWDECDKIYEKALKIEPANALILNNYAYSLSERGIRLDTASSMAKIALSKDPKNSSYLDTMGWIYYKLGNYSEAARCIEKAIALDKKNATLLEHLGDVKFKSGEKKEAGRLWQKALDLDNSNEKLKNKIEKGEL